MTSVGIIDKLLLSKRNKLERKHLAMDLEQLITGHDNLIRETAKSHSIEHTAILWGITVTEVKEILNK